MNTKFHFSSSWNREDKISLLISIRVFTCSVGRGITVTEPFHRLIHVWQVIVSADRINSSYALQLKQSYNIRGEKAASVDPVLM